jgi:hypothetical protein
MTGKIINHSEEKIFFQSCFVIYKLIFVVKIITILLVLLAIPLSLSAQYNNHLVIDSICTYRWSSITNEWVIDFRRTFLYDASGNCTEEIQYNQDYTLNILIAQVRHIRTYDQNKNLTELITYYWNT